MGAPILAPGMAGAAVYAFLLCGKVPVKEWRYKSETYRRLFHGYFAFWRPSEGLQIAYAGSHPADIPRSLWREWYGAAHDLEFWNAARRELRINNHPPKGTVH